MEPLPMPDFSSANLRGDQALQSAALNAVQIAELLVR